MRVLALAIALAVIGSACTSGPASNPTSSAVAAPSTTAAIATSATSPTTPTSSVATSEPTPTTIAATTTTAARLRPDGEDAPDFTLALGQGGEFTLSEESKPVYMIFWAEW